jgi:hypothetical protein
MPPSKTPLTGETFPFFPRNRLDFLGEESVTVRGKERRASPPLLAPPASIDRDPPRWRRRHCGALAVTADIAVTS